MDEHFWSMVEKCGPRDCWIWVRGKDPDGYGIYSFKGRSVRAHRYAFMDATGHDPSKLFVCHACDQPACCNPMHLFLATAGGNHYDMLRKGRRVEPCQKLSDSDIRKIREEYECGSKQTDIAEKHGITQPHVSAILLGKVRASVL
jgi:hypothetical protein